MMRIITNIIRILFKSDVAPELLFVFVVFFLELSSIVLLLLSRSFKTSLAVISCSSLLLFVVLFRSSFVCAFGVRIAGVESSASVVGVASRALVLLAEDKLALLLVTRL